jgi:hypothetical protein
VAQWSDFVDYSVTEYQRSLIHAHITALLDAGETAPIVPAEYFDAEIVLGFWMEEQEKGNSEKGKLSGAQIGEFFDSILRPVLAEKFAPKLAGDKKKIDQSLAQYRSLMVKLSTNDTIPLVYLQQAEKAISYVSDECKAGIGRKLSNRVQKLLRPSVIELGELL